MDGIIYSCKKFVIKRLLYRRFAIRGYAGWYTSEQACMI